MAKKIFIDRQISMPTAQVTSICRNRTESMIASYSRSIIGSGTPTQLPFRILDETPISYPKYNATGRGFFY
jgi:hypothetical protein